jgi:guanylate kinase
MSEQNLFIISAPSGAGKSTLVSRVLKLLPDVFLSISCTTRQPRVGEKDGVNYHFISVDEFRKMIRENEFLEWKEVYGNYYGTPKTPVQEALSKGGKVILEIDVQGAKDVLANRPESIAIFISPPDMETLEQRLRDRGTDSDKVIQTRLECAGAEMDEQNIFKYCVVNDDLKRATQELAEIIRNA